MVRIIHASDWHGEWQRLPEGDVYVFSGDMYPNFPDILFKGDRTGRELWVQSGEQLSTHFELDGELFRYSLERRVDPQKEARLQAEWARTHQITPFLGSPQAPIICVRGNHDFVPLSLLFEGRRVQEFGLGDDEQEMFDAAGLCFAGARGIPYIIGEWADELSDPDMRLRMAKVPLSVDVLVTHAPPQGVMDLYGLMHIGCPHITNWIQRQVYAASGPNPAGHPPLRAHLFGHNHRPGVEAVSGTVFSNAATTFNVLEL